MSRHSDLIRLRHMPDHACEAVALVQGKTRGDLANTRLLQLGLVRLVEIIGEAAARVSKDMKRSTLRFRGKTWSGCGTNSSTATIR
jgi:uncharacterized protein with HEPN domain